MTFGVEGQGFGVWLGALVRRMGFCGASSRAPDDGKTAVWAVRPAPRGEAVVCGGAEGRQSLEQESAEGGLPLTHHPCPSTLLRCLLLNEGSGIGTLRQLPASLQPPKVPTDDYTVRPLPPLPQPRPGPNPRPVKEDHSIHPPAPIRWDTAGKKKYTSVHLSIDPPCPSTPAQPLPPSPQAPPVGFSGLTAQSIFR